MGVANHTPRSSQGGRRSPELIPNRREEKEVIEGHTRKIEWILLIALDANYRRISRIPSMFMRTMWFRWTARCCRGYQVFDCIRYSGGPVSREHEAGCEQHWTCQMSLKPLVQNVHGPVLDTCTEHGVLLLCKLHDPGLVEV